MAKTFVTVISTGDDISIYTFVAYAGNDKKLAEGKMNYTLKENEDGFGAVLQTWEDGKLLTEDET